MEALLAPVGLTPSRIRCRRPPVCAPLPHSRTRALPHFPAYGYRWYDPWSGRRLSRDPIGEEGGMNLYGFVGNDGVGLVDGAGLRVMIFELGPDPTEKDDFDLYQETLAKVEKHVAAMSDSDFATADVRWNDVQFAGSRQEFRSLIKCELGSKYTHTVLKDSNQKRNLAQLSSDLDGFFSAAGNEVTFGNITSRTINLIIGHGDDGKQATIAGYYFAMTRGPVFSKQYEARYDVLVPFEDMRRQQEKITRRTGSPTVFVSCHSNTRRLTEKFHWGNHGGGPYPSFIRVNPLGGGQTLAGWSETWEVSVWRCTDDPLAATESTKPEVVDEVRGMVEVGNVTAEKTLKLEELAP